MTNQMIKCLIFTLIASLTGCASTPQTSNYYLIESLGSKTTINSNQQIVLYPIQLSDYLKSTNLHVKSNSGEVLYSPTDSWAEQPGKMLWRAIGQNLEQQSGHHVLASYEASSSCAQIKIRINELSPTITGKVVSNGRWFISAADKILKTNKFSFIGDLNADGYLISNQIIASHLNELSSELEQQITRLELCQR